MRRDVLILLAVAIVFVGALTILDWRALHAIGAL